LHYGFGDEAADPLKAVLKTRYRLNARYARALEAGA
jgi:hypothetical protein